MRNLFNSNESLFKKVKDGKPSGIIFTLLLPIMVSFLALPIVIVITMIIKLSGIWGIGAFASINKPLGLMISTGSVIIVYFLIVKFKEKRKIVTMGFSLKDNAVFKYIKGFLIGLLMIFIIAVLIVSIGNGKFTFNRDLDISFLIPFIFMIIAWIIQGASEEIMMRGHMLPVLGVKISPIVAIIISSSYFGVLHLGNPGVAPLAIVNLILFGIFASIYAIYEESLWGVCALHSAWNFAQGNIFGFLVSGTEAGVGSIINTEILENNLINGGTFGPEGGFIVTLILSAGIAILVYLLMRKNKLKR